MNSKLVALLCLLSLYGPANAVKILTIDNNEIESSNDSIACLETLFQTCYKKNYCKEADHCACLPHFCCSGDCRALCIDDVTNCYPTIEATYSRYSLTSTLIDSLTSTLIVGTFYVPAHLIHHFIHASRKRMPSAEPQKME